MVGMNDRLGNRDPDNEGQFKKDLVRCTRDCGFILKDKRNWVDEITVHLAMSHYVMLQCSECQGLVFKAYYHKHLESKCRAVAFFIL